MKIALIHGQAHHGNTWKLTQLYLQQFLTLQPEISEFVFPKEAPPYCLGCTNCFFKGEQTCPHAAKVQPVVKAMDAADLIIITSPSYVIGMTAQLKAFMDHLGYRFMAHRPERENFFKQALIISTAAGLGHQKTARDIAGILTHWGVGKIHRHALAIAAADFESIPKRRKAGIERKVRATSRLIIDSIGRVKPGLTVRLLFLVLRQMQKRNDWNERDRNHWMERGWLDKKRPYHVEENPNGLIA